MNKRPSQTDRVIDYMSRFGAITTYDAIKDLGILRLGARIAEVKERGLEVDSRFITVKNRFGEDCHVKEYRLKGERA